MTEILHTKLSGGRKSMGIIEEDVLVIENMIRELPGDTAMRDLRRMGGLTNRSYMALLSDGRKLVFRLPGEGTEQMINRRDEKVSTELAVQLGIDVQLYYFDHKGRKISQYIEGALTMTPELLREERRIRAVAEIFRRLHTSGADTKVEFEVFDMAASYERIIANHKVALFGGYSEVKEEILRMKSELDRERLVEKVPCHNDSLCENWIEGSGRLYLIDWEYAGMNDGMWDLADISVEAGYDRAQDEFLLRSYFDREPTAVERKSFAANKLYIDYLWTLWGLARVPFEGQEMLGYARNRYTRLRKNMGLAEGEEAYVS